MPGRHGCALVALIAAVLASGVLHGSQQPSFSSRALGVRVDVLVTDGRRPVSGLKAGDFQLRDNGVPQRVEVVEAGDIPLNIMLALDTSASITGKRRTDLIGASEALLDELTPLDRASLTWFSHAVVPAFSSTSDVAAIRAELRRLEPVGQTAVIDGLYTALVSGIARTGRSLLVVYTDGSDTASWLQPGDVVEAARRANVVVYAVVAPTQARRSAPLTEVADATGGQVLRVKSAADVADAFRAILREFRSRYILAYSPAGVVAGGIHTLDVRVNRRGLVVKSRTSYVGVAAGTQ